MDNFNYPFIYPGDEDTLNWDIEIYGWVHYSNQKEETTMIDKKSYQELEDYIVREFVSAEEYQDLENTILKSVLVTIKTSEGIVEFESIHQEKRRKNE